MSFLDDYMHWMRKAQDTGDFTNQPEIEYHYVHYSRFLIEDKLGIKLSLQETKKYLYEEGLLPDEYYFSKDYIDKYKHTKKPINVSARTTQA